MSDGWGWWLAGDSGRDSMLRGEIDYLSRSASAARSQTARLSSQLATLQGSLETRLAALSAAFDAYVELGDVREQLAGYPDTSAIRRDAVSTIEALGQGRTAERVEDRGQDYWLADATNAVRALATGVADPAAEERARTADPEAELFIVATVGALGAGAKVADRVAALLVCDSTVSRPQLALWEAVLAGRYGSVLGSVRASWQPLLEQDPASWQQWCAARARAGTAAGALEWLETQLDPTDGAAAPAHPATAAPDQPDALRAVALELINAGTGGETALLERSRALRAKIENPTAAPLEPTTTPAVTVTELVRRGWETAAPDSPERRELVHWMQPHLFRLVDDLAEHSQQLPPVLVTADAAGSQLDVTTEGPAPDRVAQLERLLEQTYSRPGVALGVRVALTAVLAVLAVALVIGHVTGVAVVCGVGTLAAGTAALMEVRLRTQARTDLQAARAGLQTAIGEAAQQVLSLEAARQDTMGAARDRARRLRERLTGLTGGAAAQAGGSASVSDFR